MAILVLFAMLMPAPAHQRMRELVARPGKELSSIRAATRLLGEPRSTRILEVENPHQKNIPNVKVELEFDGVSVTYLIVVCCDKTIVSDVRVSDLSALQKVTAVVIPDEREESVRAFGKPSRTETNAMVFEISTETGADALRLEYENDRLSGVRWSYWID